MGALLSLDLESYKIGLLLSNQSACGRASPHYTCWAREAGADGTRERVCVGGAGARSGAMDV